MPYLPARFLSVLRESRSDGWKIRVKRRIKKARKRWVKGYNKHSTKPRVALSFYRVRKTDGEAYIASIDYIRKMVYRVGRFEEKNRTFEDILSFLESLQ